MRCHSRGLRHFLASMIDSEASGKGETPGRSASLTRSKPMVMKERSLRSKAQGGIQFGRATRTPGPDRSSRSRLLPARIIPTYEHTVLSAALAQSEKTNCTPSLAKQQFGNRLIIRSHKQQCTPRVGSRSSHVRSER